MHPLVKLLVAIGSSGSFGFGVWHFFVPIVWNWNSYIQPRATELIIAVRAINVFFSLSLCMFGFLNMLFVFSGKANRFSITAMLAATCILWLTRLVLQIVHPQGTVNAVLQYAMLTAFMLVSLCYLVSLGIVLSQKPSGLQPPV